MKTDGEDPQKPLFTFGGEVSPKKCTSVLAPQTAYPGWLQKHLEERLGGFRSARWQRCTKCHGIILAGLDDDTAAIHVQTDPTPLTLRQDELCQWIGRPTYTATIRARTIELDRRTWRHTHWQPPNGSIVPAHVCGKRFPGFLLPPDANTQQTHHQHPPF